MEPLESPCTSPASTSSPSAPAFRSLTSGAAPAPCCASQPTAARTSPAIDASPALVAHARRRVPARASRSATSSSCPFDDASFDVVTGLQLVSVRGRSERRAARGTTRSSRRRPRANAVWGPPEQCDGEIVLDAVRALLPPPPPGAPGPLALAEDGALAALLDAAGFETLIVADVSTRLSSTRTSPPTSAPGPSPGRASWRAGRPARRRSTKRSSTRRAPFRRNDGSYRLDNIFRFAVARVR